MESIRRSVIIELLIAVLIVVFLNPLNSTADNMLNETEQAGSRLSMLTVDYMPDELKEWVAGEENSQIFIDYEDAEKLNKGLKSLPLRVILSL
ncbi:MAG TPA: hypothetical protein H9664_04145 [Firmicutes bacterium]|nr:hypothetical protein [Bacillota bacterium]